MHSAVQQGIRRNAAIPQGHRVRGKHQQCPVAHPGGSLKGLAHAGGGVQNNFVKIIGHPFGEHFQGIAPHGPTLIGGADHRQPGIDGAFHHGFAALAPAAEHILDVIYGFAVHARNDVHTAQAGIQLNEQHFFAPGGQPAAQKHRHGALSGASFSGGDHGDFRFDPHEAALQRSPSSRASASCQTAQNKRPSQAQHNCTKGEAQLVVSHRFRGIPSVS